VKRPGKLIKIVFLFAAAYITGYGLFLMLREKVIKEKTPEAPETVIVSEFPFSSPEDLAAWDEKILAEGSTDYGFVEVEGAGCVRGASQDSASALYHKQRLSRERNPFISWEWKAEKFPSFGGAEALDKKANFDFVAQVYVIFDARFFLNSKAIQYVWTEGIPAGTVSQSPYTKNVMIKVLESGSSEEWKREERDIRKDFRELFGKELEKDVVAVSFMTDADSTDSTAEAFYRRIKIGYLAGIPERKEKP